jgi:predicted membrane protein
MNFARLIPGLILIIIGISVLFKINIWSYFWPALLILLGLRILSAPKQKYNFSSSSETNESEINEVVVFSEVRRKIKSLNFKGGKLTTVFGSGKLDLSESQITNDRVVLEITSVFGESKIKVPETWIIKSEGVGVLGAYHNNTKSEDREKPVVIVKGSAIFGEVEITN